jgi:hypothetical protein
MFMLLTQMVFFWEMHVFLQLTWIGLFGKKERISTLKNLSCRKCSFHKLTQFSQGINVVPGESCNINVFLWRDTCVSLTQLNKPVWNKGIAYPHLGKKLKLQELFFSKTYWILTWNNVLDGDVSNTDGFLLRDTCVSSTQLNRPI